MNDVNDVKGTKGVKTAKGMKTEKGLKGWKGLKNKPDMSGTAWARRGFVLAGLAMIGFALFGGGAPELSTSPYLKFVAEVTLGVLVLVLPLSLAVGWLIGKVVPVVVRPIVQGACLATALIVMIALPSVLGYGRDATLPSALPRNYATGLWTVLAVVWAGAATLIVVRIVRRRTPKEPTR
ncbi:hypothetical protein KGQ20_22130 [Catenulispora sp. NF23]|uniref:hypothetical protein n=1 Tax=Catenulispora pinistramenti TaxID=2705254 RepID=UPI001BABA40A|nr:hypothetical protein [Catenulispora pinistramenti]MBS2535466.1 hypothetical protein [Catenulispora pinistramenti]